MRACLRRQAWLYEGRSLYRLGSEAIFIKMYEAKANTQFIVRKPQLCNVCLLWVAVSFLSQMAGTLYLTAGEGVIVGFLGKFKQLTRLESINFPSYRENHPSGTDQTTPECYILLR